MERSPTEFTLPGYRIRLRPIRLDDVDAIMGWVNDEDVIKNFAGMSKQITREEELAYLEAMIGSDTDRLYAIEDADGQYIGNAGIHKIYWPARNGRLGVVIGGRHRQGQGLGQEVLRLLIALGFDSLKLHKLWVVHFSSNARMAHICDKLGFVQEGVMRDEYFHRDAWHDMVRRSMLQQDYDAAPWRHGGK